MDGVKAFNLPADDMERAVRFYGQVFGWLISGSPGSGGEFHTAQTTEVGAEGEPLHPGHINGGLFRRGTHQVNGVMLEIRVSSIDEAIAKVLGGGGKVLRPKSPVLDFAFLAIVEDTEGNPLGLWEDRQD